MLSVPKLSVHLDLNKFEPLYLSCLMFHTSKSVCVCMCRYGIAIMQCYMHSVCTGVMLLLQRPTHFSIVFNLFISDLRF